MTAGPEEQKKSAARRFFETVLAGRKARADLTTVRLPLHIAPGDFSPEAADRRYELHAKMAGLNPAGWRKPPRNKGRRHCRTRIERLVELSQAGGAHV